MDLHRKPNGRWELRWREAGRYRSRTFDRREDAKTFDANRRIRKRLGHAAVPEDVPLRDFTKTYWRLHAVPNLAPSTRAFYARALQNHIIPRLGDYGVRELSPKRLARFREDLERAHVGTATVRKCLAIVQGILSFAVAEEVVEFNAAASVRKPRCRRAREPQIFLPADVEGIRRRLSSLRDRTLVSVLAYSGPRPEEVVFRLAWRDVHQRTIRYVDTKRRKTRFTPLLAPLADDLREWFLASGRPGTSFPVFPTRDGGFWDRVDWSNSRRRVWTGEPERRWERTTPEGHCRLRASRDATTRPALLVHHHAHLRRGAVDYGRARGRDVDRDARAALRRCHLRLGRSAGARRATDPTGARTAGKESSMTGQER